MTTMNEATGAVIPEWTFGDRLRKARRGAGVGQREFAEQLGVPFPRYSQWETDNNSPRDVVAVAKRVELLTHVPASWMLGLDSPNAETPRPDGPDGAEAPDVHRQGLEPRTRWFGSSEDETDAVAEVVELRPAAEPVALPAVA